MTHSHGRALRVSVGPWCLELQAFSTTQWDPSRKPSTKPGQPQAGSWTDLAGPLQVNGVHLVARGRG